jgi:pimeloyl-ACP methyl ester carboxylesterase
MLKKMLKRWWLPVAALLLGGIVALNILAYQHAHAMTHFTATRPRTGEVETLTVAQRLSVLFCGVSLPRPRGSVSTTALGAACRSIIVDCTNGVRLGAWYCPAATQGPLVILFHGYAGEKTGTLREAKAFLEMGLSVLLVDFRGSGDSSESYTTIGYREAEDVASAVRHAYYHLPHSQVILYGQSMGAAAILRAVHACGVQPDAIIAEAVFDRLLTTVRNRFKIMHTPSFPAAELLVYWGGQQAGFDGFSLNPVEYAPSIRCPILFLHGAGDPRARIEEARGVFAAVPGRKRFKEFPGLGHQASLARFPNEWKETVSQFLKDADPHLLP